jgi:c-di-AMP phosphodiesterase-like protein
MFSIFGSNKNKKEKNDISSFSENILKDAPFPFAVFEKNETLIFANDIFKEFFPTAELLQSKVENIFKQPLNNLLANPNNIFTVSGRSFNLRISVNETYANKITSIFLADISENEALKHELERTRVSVMLLVVDNYEELLIKTPESQKGNISTLIETKIRDFAAENDAFVIRHKIDRYLLIMLDDKIELIKKNKFKLLEEIKNIETESEIPVSFSIGIGTDEISPKKLFTNANDAMELAMGRGGDQVVIKGIGDAEFYSSGEQVILTRNKSRSRIIAYALSKVIASSDKVIIMGHKESDADCFASAVGIARIVRNNHKNPYIILGKVKEELEEIVAEMRSRQADTFISERKAEQIMTPKTVLIIVDSQFKDNIESKDILRKAKKTIVIDHHLKKEDSITGSILSFLEPYSSSTAELVTELLQYDKMTTRISKEEAELLLLGITVDTNRFSIKTGKRTFEAASYLREMGADSLEIKKILQVDKDVFNLKMEIIRNAEFYKDYVFASVEKPGNYLKDIIPQIADELLEIKGIKASFALYEHNGMTFVSARSVGKINVAQVMEKLGGGGHFNASATAVKMPAKEVIKRIKEEINESNSK